MPRYFFHVREGRELVEDQEGIEFPDPEAARLEAIRAARDIMAERIREGVDVSGWSFKVTDANGMLIMTVPFSEAVRRAA